MVNELFLYSLFLFLFVSILILIVRLVTLNKEIETLKKRPTTQTIELQAFLSDLMAGEGLVSVHRIDPNNLFTFSPKDSNQ